MSGSKKIIITLIAILLTSGLSSLAARADKAKEVFSQWHKKTASEKVHTLEMLNKAGRYDVLEKLLTDPTYSRTINPAQRMFFLGLVYKSQKKYKDTVAIYRKVLTNNPGFNRIRLELAHTLFLMKEYTSAKHHFDLVIASSDNKDFRLRVQKFIDAIYKKRKWQVSAYASLVPSTNINNGTSTETIYVNGIPFTIDDASKEKSGIGLSAGVNAGYAFSLTDKLDWVVGGGVHIKQYKGEEFDDNILSVEMGPRYRFQSGYIGIYATAMRRWYAGEEYGYNWGGRVHGSYRLGSKNVLFSDISCQNKKHDEQDWKDGHSCNVGTSLDHYLNSKSFVRVLGGAGLDKNEVEHLDYNMGYAGLGLYRELPMGISLYAEGKYMHFDYDGVSPGLTEGRLDQRYLATLHITKRDWNYMGYAPMLQYQYIYNDSNSDINTFDSHNVNLTLTKNF
ncbi:MAG: surface lipoprotein assembly modifier [Methyloligellaceae bacterium]